MKKILSYMLALTITSMFVLPSTVNAAPVLTRQKCKQTSTGRVCTIEKYMKISVKYSYNDAKKIVDRNNKLGSGNSQIIKYIVSLTPVTGLASLMYDLGATRCMNVFQTAVKKKTGVRFTYDYILNNNSISLNKIENGRITYEK